MKRLLMPALLVFAMGCPEGDSGETDPVDTTRVDDILALSADSAEGEGVYQLQCESCHQADGTGTPAFPDLTAYVPTATDEEVLTAILEGGSGMAAFTFLSDQELADLLAHVNDSFGS